MSTLTESFVDLETTRGAMRVHLFIPDGGGRYPAVVFYSEIFQVTGPIRRMAAALAGEGYLVAVPEVYHEFNAAHAFLRDEGTRYNPALARVAQALLLRFLAEKIG